MRRSHFSEIDEEGRAKKDGGKERLLQRILSRALHVAGIYRQMTRARRRHLMQHGDTLAPTCKRHLTKAGHKGDPSFRHVH